MKNLIKISLIAIIALFVSSCAGPFTMDDNGKTVNLSTYDPFEIDLSANASTGYSWQILPYDSTVINQVGKPEFKSNNDGAIGSAGVITFKFKTVGDGQATLKMVYKRKWEENEPPAKTFEMEIVVGTMGRILED
jgi:inhibitor of cysteine peptidase